VIVMSPVAVAHAMEAVMKPMTVTCPFGCLTWCASESAWSPAGWGKGSGTREIEAKRRAAGV